MQTRRFSASGPLLFSALPRYSVAMADYDKGADLAGKMHDLVLSRLASTWKFGCGANRGNPFNCTYAENMAYVLDSLGLFDACVDADYLPFLQDVRLGLQIGIDSYSDKRHSWRKDAVRRLKRLDEMLKWVYDRSDGNLPPEPDASPASNHPT